MLKSGRDLGRLAIGAPLDQTPLLLVVHCFGAMASFRPAKLRRTAEINHTPVSWESYFDRHFNVQVPGSGSGSGNGAPAAAGGAAAAAAGGGGSNSFRFYEVGPEETDPMLPVVLLLHGGGLSAMSWAVCVKEMAQRAGACRFLAMDARGHGDSTVVDGDYGKRALSPGNNPCADPTPHAKLLLAV